MQRSIIHFSTLGSHEIDFDLADQKAHHHRVADTGYVSQHCLRKHVSARTILMILNRTLL